MPKPPATRASPMTRALRQRPLFFEPVPPRARMAHAHLEERIGKIAEMVAPIGRVDAINIPELIDENHDGRPFYRSVDPRTIASGLARRVKAEMVINKVVAHLPSDALGHWAAETVALGLRNVVLVGGSSRYIPYPGPSVPEANRLLHPAFAEAGGSVGNIAIPQRVGEAHRMLTKTRAGAAFFTTQLLFDSSNVLDTVRRYDRLCRESSVAPAAVLASFGPLADDVDAEFVRWLGADLPDSVEHTILGPEDDGAYRRSAESALAVWSTLIGAAEAEGWSVPLGANIEQLSLRHGEAATFLVNSFAERFGPRP
jgi:5,10-methylenetetrahydrofolate reductase